MKIETRKRRSILEFVFLVTFVPLYFITNKLTDKIDIYQMLNIVLLVMLSIIMYFLLKGKSKLNIDERKKVNLYFIVKNISLTLAILVLSLLVERIAPSGLLDWMGAFASILGIQIIFVIIHSIIMLSK